MRVLFISDFILAAEQGAKQSSKAHLQTLRELFGTENVDVVSINSIEASPDEQFVYVEGQPSKLQKLLNIVSKSCFFLSKSGENRIVDLCKQNGYGLLFIDHSIYGHLIRRIKKECNIPTVTYFHGIMAYQTEEYKKHNKTSPFYFIPQRNTLYNEKLTVEYSDKVLILNGRDNENLKKFYGRSVDVYLPVYYPDTAGIVEQETVKQVDRLELLFVGGYFWPNVHGITWFVENVMPKLDNSTHLTIVGNKMDQLRENLTRENVTVIGRVESLDNYYNRADVVVGPIFEGEGMKTKTCEALMYGKIYIGTDEALEGYDELKQYTCNTVDDFISRINSLNKAESKYHPEMREIYEKNYSPKMAKERLTGLLQSMGLMG